MITTDNYEEYFLDYIEGRLDGKSRLEVESFVAAHPELRAELEEFLDSPTLDSDTSHAPSDLVDSLRHTSDYDEPDVPYFDRLAVLNLEKIATPDEQREYNRLQYENPNYKRIASQYAATVLEPDDVEYPDKRRLIVLPLWRRAIPYAAAAAVIGLAVIFSVSDNSHVTIDAPSTPTVVHTARPASEHTATDNATPDVQPEDIPTIKNQHKPTVAVPTQNGSHNIADIATANENSTAQIVDETSVVPSDTKPIENIDNTPETQIVEVDEPTTPQVDILTFDDFYDDDNAADQPHKKHRRKFWFACGKALKFVTRRVVPDVHLDIDHDLDGKISRVALCSQNKVYALERK